MNYYLLEITYNCPSGRQQETRLVKSLYVDDAERLLINSIEVGFNQGDFKLIGIEDLTLGND